MSTIVHPIGRLNFFNTRTNASTYKSLKSDKIITGKVPYLSKNTYLKCDGRALSSNFGASSTDDYAGRESRFLMSSSNFFGFE